MAILLNSGVAQYVLDDKNWKGISFLETNTISVLWFSLQQLNSIYSTNCENCSKYIVLNTRWKWPNDLAEKTLSTKDSKARTSSLLIPDWPVQAPRCKLKVQIMFACSYFKCLIQQKLVLTTGQEVHWSETQKVLQVYVNINSTFTRMSSYTNQKA